MEKYYTVSQIAYRLSAHSRSRMVSEDAVFRWIREGLLQAERIPRNIRGVGKYPYWVEETGLKTFLREMDYNVDTFFPDNE